jgi:hypothetical protein
MKARRITVAVLGLFGQFALACSHVREPRAGTLRVECNVSDATLWVDDVLLGTVSAWRQGHLVRVGFHRVEIRHPNYFTHFAEVHVREKQVVTVRAELRPQLE